MTGFRIDASQLIRKAKALQKEVTADKFRPDLLDFVRISLNTAVKMTPARALATIQAAQRNQYDNRVNYIPSVHELRDPTLIIKPDGMWLYCGGEWYLPNSWNVPPNVWAIFEQLLSEHLRRMDTPKNDFVAKRAQARFLYKKEFVQVGQSLGLAIIAPRAVKDSQSRRDPVTGTPPIKPPRGYAQVRGGKWVISVVIYLPAIDDSTYRDFDMGDILQDAMAQHRPAFNRRVQKHIERITYAVMNS
jgi:hypothetical protein